MKLLLDTHLLLWAAAEPERLSAAARKLLQDPGNELLFSAASLWEVAIKSGLGRTDFQVAPAVLRRGLLDNGYVEIPIASEHAVAVTALPPVHKDPFDRMLVAQAQVEGITLLTTDPLVARYPGPVRCLVVDPKPRPHYTMAELLAASDYSQPQPAGEREWVDAPPAGGELI